MTRDIESQRVVVLLGIGVDNDSYKRSLRTTLILVSRDLQNRREGRKTSILKRKRKYLCPGSSTTTQYERSVG